jgi:hypothetical protein
MYNCIAWAAGDEGRWWWPDAGGIYYWPIGVQRIESLAAFRQAYESVGFSDCADATAEPGFQKIAVFTDAPGVPTHAAKLTPDGTRSSKLGRAFDIIHAKLSCLQNAYGNAALFMKRPHVG